MRRVLERVALVAALTALSAPAFAQDDWARPVQGISEAIFAGQKLGVMLVTPATDELTQRVEALVRQQLLASGFAAVVMDDAPLGDLSAKSDDEIVAAAKTYPVDVVVVLRTFPGADGPTAVVRIESTKQLEARSFRLTAGQAPPNWSQPPTPPVSAAEPVEDPAAVAAGAAATKAREGAALTRIEAIGVVETLRLVAAEGTRRTLTLEPHPRSPVVRGPTGDVVPWTQAYSWMHRADLARSYRRRSGWSTAAMAAGAVFGAAGVGMLFVGLANQANCGGGSGCGRPVLLIGGASSLAVGAAGILTGLLVHRHRTAPEELETMVEEHNTRLD